MGWLIAAAIIALFLILKISVRVRFIDDVAMTLGVGIFRIKLLPSKPKTLKLSDYKIKKFRKNQEKAAQREASDKEAKKSGDERKKDAKTAKKVEEARRIANDEDKPERDIMGLIEKLTRVAKTFISRFGHHLRIDIRRMVIIIATGDAAKTAVLYGAVSGGVQCFLELIYNCMHLTIPKNEAFYENIIVSHDFLSDKTKAEVDITFSFRTWQLFDILFRTGFQFLKKA